MDDLTKQGIAQALWMKAYDESGIPPAILARLKSPQNSNTSFAARFIARLDQLASTRLSFVTPRRDRYQILRDHCARAHALGPQQFYTSNLFLGPESVVGYHPIPLDPVFSFPSIDGPQWAYQLGWHFFVGNFTDAQHHHYSIELMFWQYAQLPPPLAASLGLTDIENQTVEMHLAICDPQTGLQYRANTVLVAGTTGLIEFSSKGPFAYRLGKNVIQGLSPSGDLFPVQLRARGWDMGKSPDAEIDLDLTLENPKGYFMQGDGGCSPSVDGLGTLYYSASLLKLKAGGENVITIDGRRIALTGGSMWYDHQWSTGFMPSGAPHHAVMRAAGNLSQPPPGGWDWFMIQFHADPLVSPDGEVQMTCAALHTNANQAFYWQNGPDAPGPMTAEFAGKFIDAKNATSAITGTMTVTAWVRNNTSPNPAVYPPTNTWYPARYTFVVNEPLPAAIKQFDLVALIPSGQTGFFGNGLQYTEGGAVVLDRNGAEIGRGFAEGTGWADTNDAIVALAGLPVNDQTRGFMKPPVVSWWIKIVSFVYVLLNKAELTRITKEAKGL